MTRYVVIGAGAVGATTAAELHLTGREVVLVARGAHLAALRETGLRYIRPDGTTTLQLPVVGEPAELELRPDDVLVLATKTQDADTALAAWAWQPVGTGVAATELPVLTLQNGLDSERSALRRFSTVFGAVSWSPATHVAPGEVISPAAPIAGVFWAGKYPTGTDPRLDTIATDFTESNLGFEIVPDIVSFKAGKLISILPNALDALYPDSPLRTRAGELVRQEAREVLAAAGIRAANVAEESTQDLSGFVSQPIPGHERIGHSTWQSLVRGATVESEFLNGEIVLLARLHGHEAPVNAAVLARIGRAVAQRTPARSLDDNDLVTILPELNTVPEPA
ncbi:2-dehydropantoate 2-reductase N-terminal domain-containing protein [Actinokineospora sp. NBRC 105648]|uniref:ketopantoate reductase family protein n=1 Tax=Actinokineospora sp. NBRC 105648 TaxID=3032206 RepID=UPI0024A541D2|nr:2-dehydropantoate 2-reductase N-terminal domain-containing protein [Actinokineospora sp. NBRC 105648]GLZ42207.1 ketopantoate reductase [Actinokineospora sp. NBRC 105648]